MSDLSGAGVPDTGWSRAQRMDGLDEEAHREPLRRALVDVQAFLSSGM